MNDMNTQALREFERMTDQLDRERERYVDSRHSELLHEHANKVAQWAWEADPDEMHRAVGMLIDARVRRDAVSADKWLSHLFLIADQTAKQMAAYDYEQGYR